MKELNQPIPAKMVIDFLKDNNKKCNYITYNELIKVNDIKSILKPYQNRCLILVLTSEGHGHFISLYANDKKKTIYYFDPYGMFVDKPLEFINNDIMHLYGNYPHLSKLLLNSNMNVEYNQYPLQSKRFQTCGYWCAVRLAIADKLSVDQFWDLFKNIKDRDKLIIKIFNFF